MMIATDEARHENSRSVVDIGSQFVLGAKGPGLAEDFTKSKSILTPASSRMSAKSFTIENAATICRTNSAAAFHAGFQRHMHLEHNY
jgi:hypothetical protein